MTARLRAEEQADLGFFFFAQFENFSLFCSRLSDLATAPFLEFAAGWSKDFFLVFLRGKETEKVQQLACGIRRMGPAKAGYPLFK